MEVALVRWPGEQARLIELRRAGTPRLLIIEEGTGAPVVRDHAEDWIRVPASDADIRARVTALAARVRTLGEAVPELVEEVLVFENARVVLSPLEARLATQLVGVFGSVVSRAELLGAGWPGGDADRNDLDVHILRLRRRIEPIGLAIKTVRGKGYVLGSEVSPGSKRATDEEVADSAEAPVDRRSESDQMVEPQPPKKAKRPKKSKKSKSGKSKKKQKKRKKSS